MYLQANRPSAAAPPHPTECKPLRGFHLPYHERAEASHSPAGCKMKDTRPVCLLSVRGLTCENPPFASGFIPLCKWRILRHALLSLCQTGSVCRSSFLTRFPQRLVRFGNHFPCTGLRSQFNQFVGRSHYAQAPVFQLIGRLGIER